MRLRVARKITARHRGTTQLRAVAKLYRRRRGDLVFWLTPKGAKDAVTAYRATLVGNHTFRSEYQAQFERELLGPWAEAFPAQPGFLESTTTFLVPLEPADATPLPYSKGKVLELARGLGLITIDEAQTFAPVIERLSKP